MPVYIYECYEEDGGCSTVFEIQCNRDEISQQKPICPGCSKKKSVSRNFNDVYVFDSSPRTVGSLADKNAKKMSNDQMTRIKTKDRIKPKFTGSLPEGASLIPVDSQGNKIASTQKGKNFGRPNEN